MIFFFGLRNLLLPAIDLNKLESDEELTTSSFDYSMVLALLLNAFEKGFM